MKEEEGKFTEKFSFPFFSSMGLILGLIVLGTLERKVISLTDSFPQSCAIVSKMHTYQILFANLNLRYVMIKLNVIFSSFLGKTAFQIWKTCTAKSSLFRTVLISEDADYLDLFA